MSEQKLSYMQQLDRWSDDIIIGPLLYAAAQSADENGDAETDSPEWEKALEQVKKAIREKVLESYRNGQAAGPAKPRTFKPRR